jgi:hypothetical protein
MGVARAGTAGWAGVLRGRATAWLMPRGLALGGLRRGCGVWAAGVGRQVVQVTRPQRPAAGGGA